MRYLAGPTIVVAVMMASACGSSGAPDEPHAPTTVEVPATTAASVTTAPSTTTPAEQPAVFESVDVQTAHDGLSMEDGAQILDVRESDEWAATGVPPGAILIPLGDVAQRAASKLDKNRPVYVICNSGNRSRQAAAILVEQGFTQVYNVAGGIKAWLAADLPVEAYEPR
jgi:rhodanese-related sulfurtransferase